MDDGDHGNKRPFMSGRHVGFIAEEVIKILKIANENQCVKEVPRNVKGGDVYIVKLDSDTLSYDSKSDGFKWKTVSCSHIPKGKAETLTKRTFNIVSNKTLTTDIKRKDVYSLDFGEKSQKLFFIHYTGSNIAGTARSTDGTLIEATDLDHVDDKKEIMHLEETSTRKKRKNVCNEENTSGSQEKSKNQERMVSSEDVEATINGAKEDLQSSSKTAPVTDVFDKLMETMVSGKENPDLELCLVVSNRKSGESSFVGSKEAKKLASECTSLGMKRDHLRRRSVKRKSPDFGQCSEEDRTKLQKKHESVSEMTMFNGKVKKFPKPKKESIFSFAIVSAEEKLIHADFFNSTKKNKNADRYLKIRNHIISLWNKEKPKYVNKLRARKGLSDCGDVTAIGRVHAYLECKGVINFDAVEDSTHYCKRSNKQTSKDSSELETDEENLEPKPKKKKENRFENEDEMSGESKIIPSKTLTGKKGQELPGTPRSSGRTRNIKIPNWADVLSGKVAFRNDSDSNESVSPVKKYKNTSPAKEDEKNLSEKVQKNIDLQLHVKHVSSYKGRKAMGGNGNDGGNNEEKNKTGEEFCDTEERELDGNKSLKLQQAVTEVNRKADLKSKINATVVKGSQKTESKIQNKRAVVQTPNEIISSTIADKTMGQDEHENIVATISDVQNSDDFVNEIHDDKEMEELEKEKIGESESQIANSTEETLMVGRVRPSKQVSESEEKSLNEKKEGPKRGRGRPRKYPIEEYYTAETCNAEDRGKYEILEWAGSGNLYKVRAKGNRHMPFELKEVNFEEGDESENKTVTNISIRIEPVGFSAERNEITRSSSRLKRNKFECEICKRGFNIEYVYEEHMKSHSNKDMTDPGIEREKDDSPTTKDYNEQDQESDMADKQIEEDVDNEAGNYGKETYQEGEKEFERPSSGVDEFTYEPPSLKLGQKPECKICGTTFLTFANLRKHSLLHSDCMYECPYCAKLMKRKDYINAHIRKVHKDVDLISNPVDFSKYTHKLPLSNKKGVNNDFEKIETDQNDAEDETEHEADKLETGISKSVCPECNKLIDNKSDLEQHMLLVHNKSLEDAWYTCKACHKKFKSLVNYEVHKLSHRQKVHDCQHCGKVFQTNSQLQVHRRHDHNVQYGVLMYFGFLMSDGKIACEICSEKFETMSDYLDHRPEHVTFEHLCRLCGNGFDCEEDFKQHQESKCMSLNLHLACGKCDQRFSMYDTRRRHLISVHPERGDNFCHHCGVSFETLDELTKHFASHSVEKIFICDFCEKRFFEKRNLVDHRVLHRSTKNFKCSICDKYYISTKSLQRHVKMHLSKHKFQCTQCDSKFMHKEDLERHFFFNHTGEINKEEQGNLCNICGKHFMKRSRLIQHMQVHIKDEEKDSSYTCVHCKNVFNAKEIPLWKHMKEAHPEEVKQKTEKKELICETCGFATVHKQRMTRHLETHNPDKRFKCMYCEKVFQTTSSLLTHVIIHRGKIKNSKHPPTDCSWPGCNKKFFKRAGMKNHLVTHIFKLKNGKDNCECENCERSGDENFITYYQGTGESENILVDGNSVLFKTNDIQSNGNVDQNSETINVVITSDGIIQGYESMNVLQEAIAKIEDLEKEDLKESHHVGSETNLTDITNADCTSQNVQVQNSQTNFINLSCMNSVEPDNSGTQSETVNDVEMLNDCIVTEDNSIVVKSSNSSASVQMNPVESSVFEEPSRVNTEVQNNLIINTNAFENRENNIADISAQEDGNEILDAQNEVTIPENSNVIDIADGSINKAPVRVNTVEASTEINLDLDGYECCYCELLFPTKCMVLSHIEEDHRDHQFPVCQICDKPFISNKHLADHMVVHTCDRKFACETCGKAFRTKQCLKQHSYIHAEVKPFVCSYCGHGFTQKGFFEEHVRRHTGNRAFKCKICSKGFYSRNLRKLHMYTHTGDNPYKCEFCTKSFKEKYVLEAHLRTHREERPFQCNHCDKAFYVRPKLIRHLNTVHGIKKEYLTDYVPTRIGSGFGYRVQKNKVKQELAPEKKTVVYIDYQGNIVRQEVTGSQELPTNTTKQKYESMVAPKPLHIEPKPQLYESKVVNNSLLNQETFEVLTKKDSAGQIMVNPIISSDIETIDLGQNIVYQDVQDVQTVQTDNNIELDGENYTLVTQSEELGHLQLITQALAEVQGQAQQDTGGIQIISGEVDSAEMQVDTEGNVAVYTGEPGGEVAEQVAENFSINIGEDGTVDVADFEKIEALRTLYNDQPIVIVVESQNYE